MKLWRTALAAIALSAAACGGKHESKETAPAPVTSAVATAEAADLADRVELYGTVEAAKTAAISSRVMANIVSVPVKPGDSVSAGDVLVEIDPATAKGQESQAKGALAQARAALALAERNHQRYQALAKSGSASELELDMARMQYEQARGAVQQGEGAVEAASSVARESRVTAPFAGRISARMVEPGRLRRAGPSARDARVGRGPATRRPGPRLHRGGVGTPDGAAHPGPDRRSPRGDGGRRRRDVSRRRPGEPHVHREDRAAGRAARFGPHGPGFPRCRKAEDGPRPRRRRSPDRRPLDGRHPRCRREGALPGRDDGRRPRRQDRNPLRPLRGRDVLVSLKTLPADGAPVTEAAK